jgi:hypothetical protein
MIPSRFSLDYAFIYLQYNGSKWRGGVLKVQHAKQHFASKLVAEWAKQKEDDAVFEAAQKLEPETVGPSDLDKEPLVLLRPDGLVRVQQFQSTFLRDASEI